MVRAGLYAEEAGGSVCYIYAAVVHPGSDGYTASGCATAVGETSRRLRSRSVEFLRRLDLCFNYVGSLLFDSKRSGGRRSSRRIKGAIARLIATEDSGEDDPPFRCKRTVFSSR